MKKIILKNYTTDKYYPRIVKVVDVALQSRNFVTPIEVFISMELLERRDVENWRAGRIPCLEQVVKCNLAKAGRILRILRFHAHDLNLKPSMTVYKRKTGGGKIPLRFSKSGEKNIEEAYARHFARLGKAAADNTLSAEHEIDAREKSELWSSRSAEQYCGVWSRPEISEPDRQTGEKRRMKLVLVFHRLDNDVVITRKFICFESVLAWIYQPVVRHSIFGIELRFGHAVGALSRG